MSEKLKMQSMEAKSSVKHLSKQNRETPKFKQGELKHQYAKEGCKLQGIREGNAKEASQQLEGKGQLSQSVQSYTARVQTSEALLQQEEQKVQELMEICNRQQQNVFELRYNIEQLNLKYCEEVKSREATTAKLRETSQMLQAFHSACNIVTNSLQRVFEGKNTFQSYIDEMKNRSEQMQSSLSGFVQSLPSLEDLKMKFHEEQQKTKDLTLETQRKCDATRKHYRVIEESTMTDLSGLKNVITDLEMQILSEENEAERARKLSDAECKEMNEQIQFLLSQIGDITDKNSVCEKEFQKTQDEIEAATSEVKKLESELSENKMREADLETDLAQLMKSEEELKKSLLERLSEMQDLEQELDVEDNQSRALNSELEETRSQLQELKNDISIQVAVISEEYQKVLATSDEMEVSLQKLLNNLGAELATVNKKEQDLIEESVQIENALQCLSESHSQALQSESTLESDLVATEETLQKLMEEKKTMEKYLAEKGTNIEKKQQILLQMQANYDKSLSEIRCQLASLKQEENLLMRELDTLKSTEQDYQSKIKAIQSNTSNVCAQMTEQCMQHTKKLQKGIAFVEKDIESLAFKSKKDLSEFEHKIKQLSKVQQEKDKIICNLNATISKQKEESESNVSVLNKLSKEKEETIKMISELTEKASHLTKESNIRQQQQQENSWAVEKDQSKLMEISGQVSGLEIKYRALQSEYSKFVTENESEKQVYLKGLKDFQNTVNFRSEEVKALHRQISVWKDRVHKEELDLEKVNSNSPDLKQKAEAAKVEMAEVERTVQEWRDKMSSSDVEASKAEKEAAIAKRSAEHLRNKIAAHKAEKRRKAMAQESTFKVPTPVCAPQSVVAPQISATVPSDQDDKENTPRSILRTSSKPPTPQQRKNVAFISSGQDDKESTPRSILKSSPKPPTPQQQKNVTFADYDDGSSSASSIMLEPEMIDQIVKNPAMRSVIEAQHKERHYAKRRLANSEKVNDFVTPAKKVNYENEISSSTPENNPDPFDFL